MSQTERAAYWAALKELGYQPDKHYREHSIADLKAEYEERTSEPLEVKPRPAPVVQPAQAQVVPPMYDIPRSNAPSTDMAGTTLYQDGEDSPIRVDGQGRTWFREEVRKPGYAKPRARRLIQYMDPGVQKVTAQAGQFVESFEIAGTASQAREVKITLPSFQVGIYADPRYPFKVHTYNSNEGFNLFEVQKYFGGAELVPASIKRMYVENDLCYDIRSTIQAIQALYREMQLKGAL